jgi:hypothetical protein
MLKAPSRPDVNWLLIDDLASIEPYVEIFNLGKLVPLAERFPPFTPEEIEDIGLENLTLKRQEEVMTLSRNTPEQTTYYTVLDERQWAEMKHALTMPKQPLSKRKPTHVSEKVDWFETFLRVNYLPTAFTFVLCNTAIIGVDTFWSLRFSVNGKWDQLMAEHVPPQHHYKRRT